MSNKVEDVQTEDTLSPEAKLTYDCLRRKSFDETMDDFNAVRKAKRFSNIQYTRTLYKKLKEFESSSGYTVEQLQQEAALRCYKYRFFDIAHERVDVDSDLTFGYITYFMQNAKEIVEHQSRQRLANTQKRMTRLTNKAVKLQAKLATCQSRFDDVEKRYLTTTSARKVVITKQLAVATIKLAVAKDHLQKVQAKLTTVQKTLTKLSK